MPVEVVAHMLSDQNASRRLQFQLILQCAPFLKGIKVACIINIERRSFCELNGIFKGTGISYHALAVCKERCLIMLFRREEMEDYLRREEIREFLGEYGYAMQDLMGMLRLLAERVGRYSRQDICFPHEIGAFLDYPIEDVRGFIRNGGQDCLLAGYWKVYHNREQAQLTFLAYDQAKISAVNEFLIGKSIRDIVYNVV